MSTKKIRMSLVIENMMKGMTRKDAMLEAGYSESYAHTGLISQTEEWKELIEQHLPEDLLTHVHQDLLVSSNIGKIPFGYNTSDAEIRNTLDGLGLEIIGIEIVYKNGDEDMPIGKDVRVKQPDRNTRLKAIDLAYKLRGSYAPDKLDVNDSQASKRLEKLREEKSELKARYDKLNKKKKKNGRRPGKKTNTGKNKKT